MKIIEHKSNTFRIKLLYIYNVYKLDWIDLNFSNLRYNLTQSNPYFIIIQPDSNDIDRIVWVVGLLFLQSGWQQKKKKRVNQKLREGRGRVWLEMGEEDCIEG